MPAAPAISDFLPQPPHWHLDWTGIDATFPWIARLRGCSQDPIHHPEGDVWIHTRLVVEALVDHAEWRALPPPDRLILFAAALLHDVAKPDKTRIDADGRISSRGHARAGSRWARCLLWRQGWSPTAREQVAALVLHHMHPFFLAERSDADALRRITEISVKVPCAWVALHADADALGRQSADRSRLLDQIALFRMFAAEQDCLETPFPFGSNHGRVAWFRERLADPRHPLYDDCWGTVVVMAGLPATGKNTWLAHERPGLPTVSLDDWRVRLGIPPDAADQGPVVAAAVDEAKDHLRRHRPFAWNATGLTHRHRSRILNLVHDYGARSEIVHLETQEGVLRERNRARTRTVPDGVIDAMILDWECPDLTEAHRVNRLTTR